jgi:hypothetical protein
VSGSFNKGIFLEIKSGNGAGEAYRIIHPVACVNGIIRGSMYGTITESVYISSIFRTSSTNTASVRPSSRAQVLPVNTCERFSNTRKR